MKIAIVSDTNGLRRPEVLPPVAGADLGFNSPGDALRDELDPRTRLELGL